MEFTLWIIPFLCVTFVDFSNGECPLPESIVPCSCITDDEIGALQILCEYKEMDSIYNALDEMSNNRLRVNLIQLSSSGALSLRPKLFGKMSIETVELFLPNLKTVNYYTFSLQEYNLKSISYRSSKMSQLPIFAMTTLKALDKFEFSETTSVEVIEANLFRPLPSSSRVKELTFSDNGITVIEKDAFVELHSLKALTLNNNLLKSLDFESLPLNVNSLDLISLQSNKFSSLPSKVLARMRRGSTLDLYDNNITKILGVDFANIIQNGILVDLGENNLQCSCAFTPVAVANEQGMMTIQDGTCYSPPELKDRQLSSLEEDDFSDCT